eukprot:s2220_g4.t1
MDLTTYVSAAGQNEVAVREEELLETMPDGFGKEAKTQVLQYLKKEGYACVGGPGAGLPWPRRQGLLNLGRPAREKKPAAEAEEPEERKEQNQ